ncbi:MAG: PIN domain-containing protein [Solirubrobacterales bacterium]
MSRVLLDTSAMISEPGGLSLPQEPLEAAVSVVTLGELESGVLMASDEATRARRLETLISARERAEGFDVDQRIAGAYARLVAQARRSGRRLRANDTWIAATALVHEVPVVTRDQDFEQFEGVELIRV